MSNHRKYTKDIILEAVKTSNSVAGVLRELGLREAGGNYSHIKKRIVEYGIDTSHFIPPKHYLRPGRNKLRWEDVLVLECNGRRKNAKLMRRALVESGVEYKCRNCGVGDNWQNAMLVLEVNHIDGNWLDNRPSNVEFLCPNCHSQTDNYCGRGIKKPLVGELTDPEVLEASAERRPGLNPGKRTNKCLGCGKTLKRSRSKKCIVCHANSQPTKITWPANEQLKYMLIDSNYSAVGRTIGVSDNAIRKKLRRKQ